MREYRRRNPDSNRLTLRRWYANNREDAQHNARQRYYRDPILRFVHAVNVSANRSGKAGRLTRDDLTPLFPNQLSDFPAGNCTYCTSVVAPGCNATLDHISPDGPHSMENVALSCTSCNSSRQAMPVDTFKSRLQTDLRLLDHIATTNKAKVAGFLTARYHLEIEDILRLVKGE